MEILNNKNNTAVASASGELVITDIKAAVKNENRVNIFVNGEYSFSLDIAQVINLKVKKGQKISPEQLVTYQHASAQGKLYQRTLEWVLTRPHSVYETKTYLKRKQSQRNAQASFLAKQTKPQSGYRKIRHDQTNPHQFSEADFDQIIAKLVQKNYLNDLKFTEYYVENRFSIKGISRRRLELELAKKGIDKKIIAQVLEHSTRNDTDEINKIIAKKAQKYDPQQLIQYLVRQGFDYETSKSLVLEKDSQNLA